MSDAGFIPAYRQLFDPDHDLAPDKRRPASKIHAWLDLCQMAQHEDGYRQNGTVLNRGEVCVSMRFLAKRWKWGIASVKRFVSELEASTRIGTVRGTERGTVYHLVNYDTYAVLDDRERNTERNGLRNGSGTGAEQKQPPTTNQLLEREREKSAPPRVGIQVQEMVAGKGIDLQQEWVSYQVYCEAHQKRYANDKVGFENWLMRAVRDQQSKPQKKKRKSYEVRTDG